jgi:two-component system, OmpR family, alkaline phosphatase synthesis response regulator PhoP
MNAKVYILEPDALQRDLMTLALKRHQLDPKACSDTQEALKLIEAQRPGVLIVDLLLRGQNGLDFLNELKIKGLLESTKILVVSPLGFPEVVLKAAKAGVAAFLIKPVDPEQLAEKVLSLLSTGEIR